MKKMHYIILSALCINFFTPNSLMASVPPPPATEPTQILNNLELMLSNFTLLEQLATQADQYANELAMYANMEINLKNISNQVWTPIEQNLQGVMQIVQQGQSISYAQQNLASAFQAKYPGYQAPTDFRAAYQNWSRSSLDGLRTVLEAAGLQSQQFATEESALRQFRAMSQSSQGRMQAIQVGNQIALEQVAQLQKLRQLQMTQSQAQNNYLAAERAEKDAKTAQIQQVLEYKPLNTVNYQGFKGGSE